MQLIPLMFVTGGTLTVIFAALLIISDIFVPVTHITRAMTAAADDTEHADRYMVASPRRDDEIGKTSRELNHLLKGVAENIAMNREAESKLRQTGQYMQAVLDSVVDGLIIINHDGIIESFSPSAEKIFGHRAENVMGASFRDLLLRPGNKKGKPSNIAFDFRLEKPPQEFEAIQPDGSTVPVELTIGSADYAGRKLYIATVRDISSRKQMESYLEQAQRMDTIGRMTGGIAHDFNNMLTVIAGNLEILERRLKDDDAMRDLVLTALESVDRGSDLTQRLLAFSRRQVLKPRTININERLPDIQEMMRRAVREDITISTKLDPNLWDCRIDPMQLENALINLSLNARDAIPGNGWIMLETENVTFDKSTIDMTGREFRSGQFAMISISDNGTGIKKEIANKVFDPFFTTKDVGKGTGLGLSMVYGFTHQSGGFVSLSSEPGHGTTVKLYFPKVQEEDLPASGDIGHDALARENDTEFQGGGETVLVVEDEPEVLQFLTNILRDLGYRVTHARDGSSALSRLARRKKLDLLLTDVIMPGGMNGEELSRRVHERFPGVKTLFISGYTRDALVDQGNLREGCTLLSKPFTRNQLARKVREVLDAPSQARPGGTV